MKKAIYYLIGTLFLATSCTKETKTLFKQRSSDETGITFNNQIVETDSANILTEEYIFNGGGVAVGDFNGDNRPDLFFTGNQVSNKLYLNKGDFKFDDISAISGIEAKDRWNTGSAVVDINNDGLLDLYVCSARELDLKRRANLLFVNQGNDSKGVPKFKEMAQVYGIAETGNSMGATFFDYDQDGNLDLYVLNNEQTHTLPSNYRQKVTDGSAVSNDRLYHNNGDGTFTDVTLEAGITIEGFGLGIAVADLNYDGWPDIYISNDYLTNDLLYVNNGDGTFSNSIEPLVKHQSKFSMGSDIADYNNDGYLDIMTLDMLGEDNYRMKTTVMGNNYINYVLNERWGYQYQYMRNMLHLGNGPDIPFSEIGLLAGVSKTDWSWAPLFVDMDNDGFRDLLITNGFPRDITDMDFSDFRLSASRYISPGKMLDSIPTIKIPNYAYKNNADLTFTDKGKEWGLDVPSFSNGAAFVDLDDDGDMDYVVNNINDEAFVFENTANSRPEYNNYIKVKLKGSVKNRMGIGAKLAIKYGEGEIQYEDHHLARGYMSSVEPISHFGLGQNSNVRSVEVLWSDGTYQKVENVKANQTIEFSYENAALAQNLSFPLAPKATKPVFQEVSNVIGIDYVHEERDYVDYNEQRILPHKLSQNGPSLAVGDMNGDQLEDFIVGSSSKYSPVLFFQNQDGTFSKRDLFQDDQNKLYEEEGLVLFDLENDGDLDLYMVSGSNEFPIKDAEMYQDRLLINDGKGNYTISRDKMPIVQSSGSVVKAADFDNDGYMDLFVGGRAPIGQFPLSDKSYLLKNEKGILVDVTDVYAKELRNVGMVTDAAWMDTDNDGLSELVVVGEFMPITIFNNRGSSFVKQTETGLENLFGWWESIVSGDFDNDGDIDLVAGNSGRNNFYQPSFEHPVTILAKDFDSNGSLDPIMFSYLKGQNGSYESYPINFWSDINKQSPIFRAKFNLYKEYALANRSTLLNAKELEGAAQFSANFDRSIYIENTGNGQFQYKELPIEAQFAPVNAMQIVDFNKDNNPDLLLIGNDFGNEMFVGRYDAFNGLVLKGDGKGGFQSVAPSESGFVVPGDSKSLSRIESSSGKDRFIATQNRGALLIFDLMD